MPCPIPAIALALLLAPAAPAQPSHYTVTRILPQGPAHSWIATGMNDQGHVVGWSQFFDGSTSLQAWVWSPAEGLQYLPDPPFHPRSRAIDINEAGLVLGDGGFDSGDAWLWDGSTYELLGHLPGDTCSVAASLDESGTAAITSRTCTSFLVPPNAALDAPGAPMTNAFAGAWATRLNDAGVLVGYTDGNTAFRVVPGQAPQLLGPLGSKPLNWASAVNAAGVIVGEAANANGNGHVPFRWTEAGGMQEIGNFGGSAGAVDVNDAGTVLGSSGPSSSQPWIWSERDGLTFIAPLVDPAQQLGILSVKRINAGGQILVHAIDNVTGQTYPAVLTPDGVQAWSDLGHALAGTWGAPSLVGSGSLAPDTPWSLTLADGLQHSTAFLVLGLARVDAPFKGGVLVPTATPPEGTVVAFPTGMLGSLTFGGVWPAGVPAGTSLYVQAWIADPAAPAGLSATNALEGVTP